VWKSLLVLAIAAAAGTFELPGLFKRSVKEAVVYGVMLATGTVLSVAAMNLVSWPSPINVLVTIFRPVNEWIAHFFR